MIGKYAIVTGASSGIGKAIAEKLVDSGVKVFGLDINENCNSAIKSYICDVSNEKQIIDIMTLVKNETKRIDYLVNCAGMLSIGDPLPIKEMSIIQWKAMMQINLESVLIMIKSCYPFMRDGEIASRIVNLSSEQVRMPQIGFAPYMVSKAGIEALTKCAAQEFLHDNIRVNAIALGTVRTNILSGMISSEERIEQMFNNKNESIPYGIASSEQIADMIMFLLSESSSYMTGEVLFADGGNYLKTK